MVVMVALKCSKFLTASSFPIIQDWKYLGGLFADMATSARKVYLHDRRNACANVKSITLSDIDSFSALKDKLSQTIDSDQSDYLICSRNGQEINDQSFSEVSDGGVLYIVNDIKQDLPAQTEKEINFIPHYDTLIKSGMYEYYASEGHNPLAFAFAELIDNSLSATVANEYERKIELRLMLDEQHVDKSCIYVIDNGCGMTSKQLNNWAIYRLSKFIRDDDPNNPSPLTQPKKRESGAGRNSNTVPRSLNSDISYFGVGGKQAIFFIGDSTRMISKPASSKDVHELSISKEEFEKREKNNDSIYSGYIRNRMPGDDSHISSNDDQLKSIISEEPGKESFTCVAINNIHRAHIKRAKQNYKIWCRQLAHIYHYYIHGPNGNHIEDEDEERSSTPSENITIEVNLYLKGNLFRHTNLQDVKDDIPTQYNSTTASIFEFRAHVENCGFVEGMLRYHPFLYDHETFPTDYLNTTGVEEEHDYGNPNIDLQPARGKRPIFECYWNGRLIPYTTIHELDWCAAPKKTRVLPMQCFNRISGVLWVNDKFQVCTNKLTFLDLEHRMRKKSTTFTKVEEGQEKRGSFEKQFSDWLKNCHQNCDKQIMFCDFQAQIVRPELGKGKQQPWGEFDSIVWDNKHFKAGDMVKLTRCHGNKNMCATIQRFLLYGDHEEDTFGTGGEVEVVQEPQSVYDNVVRVMPLLKLDRFATSNSIASMIAEEEYKLPDRLIVTWPEGDEIKNNQKLSIGGTIGALKIEIVNRKGDLISKLPSSIKDQRNLLVDLKILRHARSGDVIILQHTSQHAKNWPYWFTKMDNFKMLGAHTIVLQVLLGDSRSPMLCGKQLPVHEIKFTITEGKPVKYQVGMLDGPFRVGIPFNIPLEFTDSCDNPASPGEDFKPAIKATGLVLKIGTVKIKGNVLIVSDVIAEGIVSNNTGENFTLTVVINELKPNFATQTLKIRLLPGLPYQLHFKDEDLRIENGCSPKYQIAVTDIAGNPTLENRASLTCNFMPLSKALASTYFPEYSADLSKSSEFTLTGEPIRIRNLLDSIHLEVCFRFKNVKNVNVIYKELEVMPSSKIAQIMVYYTHEGDLVNIKPSKDVVLPAGSVLSGLFFKLLDENEKEVKLTQNIISKLKLNWMPSAIQKKRITLSGNLPDVLAPFTSKSSQYCHLSINTESSFVDFGFTIRTKSGDVSALKAKLTKSDKVKLGDRLDSDILVALLDSYGNTILKQSQKEAMEDLKHMSIVSDVIDYSKLEKAAEQSTGYMFTSIYIKEDAPIGHHQLCIEYRDFKDYLMIHVSPGSPAMLKYIHFNPEKPITIHNDKFLDHEISVQVCDTKGNQCPQPNIRVQLISDDNLKLLPTPHFSRTDSKGQASFGVFSISTQSNILSPECPLNQCVRPAQKCRGIFKLFAKASIGRYSFATKPLVFHIPCDPECPATIQLSYDAAVQYTAGDRLCEFEVMVKSEDGLVMKTFKPNQIMMKVWKTKFESKEDAFEYSPSSFDTKDKLGSFYFRDRIELETACDYSIQFFTCSGKIISSEIVTVKVKAGTPEVVEVDDAEKQEIISSLTKEREQYQKLVDGYRSVFNTFDEISSTLDKTYANVNEEVMLLQEQVGFLGNSIQLTREIGKLQNELDAFGKEKRRKCQLQPAPNESGILGKVGHLGLIENETAAHVISWHLASDIDCIITYTMDKARQIYHSFGSRLQVLALNTIYQKNLPNWSKPLPHEKIRNFAPTGNPIYARDLFVFPKEPSSCQTVFGMLLGDTILLDTIDDATKYREKLVKHAYCPTLLTRTGDRIRSNGKFGGAQNKAPSIEKLRGAIFGQPIPSTQQKVTTKLEDLNKLASLMEKRSQVKSEIEEHKSKQNSVEIREQYDEWKQAESQLSQVDLKLANESGKSPAIEKIINNGSRNSAKKKALLSRSSPRRGRRPLSPVVAEPVPHKRFK